VRQTGGGEEIFYPLHDAQGHAAVLVTRTGGPAGDGL
jgi:hypothetical protein